MNIYKVITEVGTDLKVMTVEADTRGKAYRAAADRYPNGEVLSINIIK